MGSRVRKKSGFGLWLHKGFTGQGLISRNPGCPVCKIRLVTPSSKDFFFYDDVEGVIKHLGRHPASGRTS